MDASVSDGRVQEEVRGVKSLIALFDLGLNTVGSCLIWQLATGELILLRHN